MLSSESKTRIAQLIRLLGSDQDGEVLATVHAIKRILQSEKADLHDIAKLIEAKPIQTPKTPPPPPSRPSPSRPSPRDRPDDPWFLIDLIFESDKFINLRAKDREFITKLVSQNYQGFLSEKQILWVDDIFHRIIGVQI